MQWGMFNALGANNSALGEYHQRIRGYHDLCDTAIFVFFPHFIFGIFTVFI